MVTPTPGAGAFHGHPARRCSPVLPGAAVFPGLAFALLFGCVPNVGDRTSLVSGPRLLAVQAVPPEGPLQAAFGLTALYVDAEGPVDASALSWAECLLPKPLSQPGPVAQGCFVDRSPDLIPLGDGGSVEGTIPENACELFGPDSPPPAPGQPTARPTDPDSTGGYYLPVRIGSEGGNWSVALERIACQPSGVTQPVFAAFSSGYHLNANPVVADLSRIGDDGGAASLAADQPEGAPALVVSPGERVTLQASWPECPTAAVCGDGFCSAGETATTCPRDCGPAASSTGCGGAEIYLYIDPTSEQITTQRESMVVSWYATAGSFDVPSDGRDDDDLTTNVVNGWTGPATAGSVHLWVVLHDARGGVGWASYTVLVEP